MPFLGEPFTEDQQHTANELLDAINYLVTGLATVAEQQEWVNIESLRGAGVQTIAMLVKLGIHQFDEPPLEAIGSPIPPTDGPLEEESPASTLHCVETGPRNQSSGPYSTEEPLVGLPTN